MAMFQGMLPNSPDNHPYLNRFVRQLTGVVGVGGTEVVKNCLLPVQSDVSLLEGYKQQGYKIIGAGAMNWFQQEPLRKDFDEFLFTGTNARKQIEFIHEKLPTDQPFFAFINFGETHAPFSYEGKPEPCPVDVRARLINWPPRQKFGSKVGRKSQAFEHQMEAAEYLDKQLPVLFSKLPKDTVVIVCGDHGEAFGEDGYWGHGHNHRSVLEVPLTIFRLDGASLN